MKIFPIKLEDSLHLKLKLAAAVAEKPIKQFVTEAIEAAIKETARKEAQQ